jgi:tRNA(fMet)-specific endonuclease VapC
MRLVLDTNRYRDFWDGVAEVVRNVETADEVLLPFVVVAELRAGFLNGTRQAQNERALRQFLAEPGIEILLADEQTTSHYAVLQNQLWRQGTPIPINDLWIASLVLQHGLTLYARDKHFDHLPQLMRI